MSGHVAVIRWRDDTGWELRCNSCARLGRQRYWPLTDEFWAKTRGMQNCLACHREREARNARERYLRETTFRERRRLAAQRYRRLAREAQRIKDAEKWQRVKADPALLEAARAKGRAAQRRYRERWKAA